MEVKPFLDGDTFGFPLCRRLWTLTHGASIADIVVGIEVNTVVEEVVDMVACIVVGVEVERNLPNWLKFLITSLMQSIARNSRQSCDKLRLVGVGGEN